MRPACLGLLVSAILAAVTARSEPIQILSLSKSGDLAWVNTNFAAGTYRVEFKHELTDNWQTVPGLESVVGTSSATEVPMNLQGIDHRFFRVLWLDAPLADSYNEFSDVQGKTGWQYGYALPASAGPTSPIWFNLFPSYSVDRWVVDENLFWTFLGRDTMHPNGTVTSGGKQAVEQWPVLRWTASSEGSIRVAVSIKDLNANGGNGVILHVFHQGAEVKTETLVNGGESNFELNVVVAADDHLDFALDPNESDDLSDVTQYRVLIYPQ
ncbi:hypothetical protein GC207_06530 [bacterium]|nr:hypothetical protein [bacterium]